jgi:hypothetical protein
MRPLGALICKARPNIETTFLLCQGLEVVIHQLLDRIYDVDRVSFDGNTIPLNWVVLSRLVGADDVEWLPHIAA